MFQKHHPIRSAIFLVMLFLCSCATVHFEEPVDVSLIGLRVQNATVLETAVQVTVRVENENPQPLQVSGAVHKIYLDGHYLGKGMSSEPVTVPGLGTSVQSLTIYLRNLSLANRIRPILDSQALGYEMKSTLYLETSGGSRRLRTESNGRLDLRNFTPAP